MRRLNKLVVYVVIFHLAALAFFIYGCERSAWREARDKNSVEGYQDFIKEYPDGQFAPRAWRFIDAMTFKQASDVNTPDSFRDYLLEFPDGEFADRARERIRDLTRVKVDRLSVQDMASARVSVHTSMGKFSFRLFGEDAPETSRNLLYLTLIDFYDGLTIHRVIEDYAIQMGDPSGDSRGGPGYMIAFEPNERRHVRGVVSMWRLPVDPDTAGSQFFICLKDQPHLDGKYTVFGEVVEGMDVVDRISKVETTGRQGAHAFLPLEPVYIRSVEVAGLEIEW